MRELLETLQCLHGHSRLSDFRAALVEFARRHFDCDVVAYSQFDQLTGRELTALDDAEVDAEAQGMSGVFEATAPTHPLIPLPDLNTPVMRVSDVAADATFRETAVYREYLRHLDIQYQLVLPVVATHSFHTGVTLNRSRRDFGQDDLEWAKQLHPHLVAAMRTCLLQEQIALLQKHHSQLLGAANRTRLDVSFDGRLLAPSPLSTRLTEKAFGAPHTDVLPPGVQGWLKEQLTLRFDPNQAKQESPYSLGTPYGSFTLRLAIVLFEAQWACLLLEQNDVFDPIPKLRRSGLTKREAEVLYRLTFGETDKQIAKSLGMRPATARTHVERIRTKLNVETRTAAASIAQQWLHASES